MSGLDRVQSDPDHLRSGPAYRGLDHLIKWSRPPRVGNARSCGQDGLVVVATALGVKASKDAVRMATLPPEGDTPLGTIRAYQATGSGHRMMCSAHPTLGKCCRSREEGEREAGWRRLAC